MSITSASDLSNNKNDSKYSISLAILIVLLGFTISVYAFYPGWMSVDSSVQYFEARQNHYNDWQPVLMAWWWHLLDKVHKGPALFLMQNLTAYWGSLLIFYLSTRKVLGKTAFLFPLAGFAPGLLFPLGQIWKDVVFAVLLILCLSIAHHIYSVNRKSSWLERTFCFLAITLAYGVKTNGLTAIPFIIFYWIHAERPNWHTAKKVVTTLCVTFGVTFLASAIVPKENITHSYGMQYTQSYDLLGISVATKTNLLPDYINKKIQPFNRPLSEYYFIGSNNLLFYNTEAGNLTSLDPLSIGDLQKRWIDAIIAHPVAYLKHRAQTFASLLRIGERTPAWIAKPEIVDKNIPFSFKANAVSDALTKTEIIMPYVYFPWLYLAILLFSLASWKIMLPSLRGLMAVLQASAWAFILPHIIVVPASDFRYLYYCYFCAAFAFIITLGSAIARLDGSYIAKPSVA